MLVNCHLLLGLILIQTVCTLMVETTRSVASGLSMSYKKKINSLPTIFVSSADNLCKYDEPRSGLTFGPILIQSV